MGWIECHPEVAPQLSCMFLNEDTCLTVPWRCDNEGAAEAADKSIASPWGSSEEPG